MISKYGLIYSFSKTEDTLEVYFSDEEIIKNERKEDIELFYGKDSVVKANIYGIKKYVKIRINGLIYYPSDEFIALGVCNDKELVEEYIERIQINLEKQVSSMRLSYPLSTSCGYVLTDPALDFSLNDYISQADDYMYEQKQKAKKNAAKIFFKKEK